MGVAELTHVRDDQPVMGRDYNRLVDAVLGNDGMQRKWLGYDGTVKDVDLGTTLSTGNYGDIIQTTDGKHVSVRHSAGTADTPANQVFAVDDDFALVGRGKQLRFYKTDGSNSANFYHSGTNDVIKSDDGLQIVGAVNVGSAINATDAGDIWASGGLSLGTYSNPANGQVLCDSITTTGNVIFGDANTDSHVFVGLVTFRNAASTAFPLYVDAANNRAQFGSTTALGSATNSKVEVNGGRAYVAAGSEDLAIGVRYGPTTGTYFLGASNSATPDAVLKNNGGTQTARLTNGGVLIVGTATAAVNEEKIYSSGAVTIVATPAGTPDANALYSENVPKAYALFQADASINRSFNVTSISKVATGRWTVTIDRDFSAATYAVVATPLTNSAYYAHVATTSYAAGTFEINCRDAAGTLVDPNNMMFIAFGPQ